MKSSNDSCPTTSNLPTNIAKIQWRLRVRNVWKSSILFQNILDVYGKFNCTVESGCRNHSERKQPLQQSRYLRSQTFTTVLFLVKRVVSHLIRVISLWAELILLSGRSVQSCHTLSKKGNQFCSHCKQSFWDELHQLPPSLLRVIAMADGDLRITRS